MQRQIVNSETKQNSIEFIKRRHISLVDVLVLLAFLPIALLIIFLTASVAMQRSDYEWLPIALLPEALGNYGVDFTHGPKLAPVNPQIIEAVRLDSQNNRFSVSDLIVIDSPPISNTLTPTPTANLYLIVDAGGPYQGDEGTPILVTARIPAATFDLVPGGVSYAWDLDNDGIYDDAQTKEAAVVFVDEGEYAIAVQAQDWLGRTATDRTTVTVFNVPPTAHIEGPTEAEEAQIVFFRGTISDPGNDVLLYSWDFGDGSPPVNTTLNPGHIFYDNGDYTVRLRVQDNDGGVSEDTLRIHVKNLPPIVEAGPDQVVDEGSRVTFTGTARDPAGELDPLTYEWDFDFTGTFTPDARGPQASTIYIDGPADIVAALRVRDDDGGETIDTVKVRVNNVPPQITGVSTNSPVGQGSHLNIQVAATDVGNDTLTYSFDWDNDGAFDLSSQSGTASRLWTNHGDFTIGIEVADGDGGTVFTTSTVSVLNLPPTAVAVGPTGAIKEGTAIRFDGSGSSDPGSDVLTYTWQFGDGATASGVSPTHTYADNGVYTTTLTVTDDGGASDTQAIAVTIVNANPVANAGPDITVDEGQTLTFNGTATDPGIDDILRYAWDFSYDGLNFVPEATGASVQIDPTRTNEWGKVWEDDGPAVRNVALRVRDDDYPFPLTGGGEIGEHIDILQVTIRNVPPQGVDANGPYNGRETLPVNLSGTATDVEADKPLIYEWDIDNDGVFDLNGQSVSHIWNTAGDYPVTLRVTDKDGGTNLATTQVFISNAPPTAVANGPYTTTVNLPVTVSGEGSSDPTNDPLTYQWDFGDGTPPLAGITATHTYTDDGVYTAVLLVDDGRDGTHTANARITVNNLPPTAVALAQPTTTLEGGTIDFDGSGSSDPGIYDILTYRWDFGDGTAPTSGITTSHTYTSSSVYLAQLTVTDDAGAADTAGITITVQNVPPTAVASANPLSTFEGAVVSFDAGGSSDPGADIVSYHWDFGDGSMGSGITTTHVYPDNDTYSVVLTVTDDDGASDTDTLTITTSNVAPNAILAADPTPAFEGAPVLFDGSGSNDPGLNDTLTYHWDFGDGSPAASGSIVSHTYFSEGEYTATLTVTDDDGDSDTAGLVIAVQNAPPVAAANVSPAPADEGTPVTFDASGSSDPGNDPLTYQWDFDDGSPLAAGMVVDHTYADDGTYAAVLVVTDDSGATDSLDIPVIIQNTSPAVDAGGPYVTAVNVPVELVGNANDVPADTLTYIWDLDGDGLFETPGRSVIYTGVTTGTYSVTLQVDDGDGGMGADTTTVQVNNIVPLTVPGLLYVLFRRKKKSNCSGHRATRRNHRVSQR